MTNPDTNITITPGFSPQERAEVARLYWQAFGAKLGRAMGPDARALRFFEAVVNADFALAARDGQGQLLGVAGFKTSEGGLAGGGLRDLRRVYGQWGSLWRGMLLSVLERDLEEGILLMDGIFVNPKARGRGVGTALLRAIAEEAARRGCREVRLDVIDTNPRARALYEREGFVAQGVETTGPFRWVFGFKSATRMTRAVG